MKPFQLVSDFKASGDQPAAIDKLAAGFEQGHRFQTLIGVTGSGKTFTMASVIERLQCPTLIISHNKTLAAQLYRELKDFFPHNQVCYYISHYDYYQPEAYVPSRDLYIEKEVDINQEIERLCLATVSGLSEHRSVIVVASVSCIYSLGSPHDFRRMSVTLEKGQSVFIDELKKQLVDLSYERHDSQLENSQFRVRGDIIDVKLAYNSDCYYRISCEWDEIASIRRYDHLNHHVLEELDQLRIYPASLFLAPRERVLAACKTIKEELDERLEFFQRQGKIIEAARLKTKTEYDLEMMREIGHCKGMENYSRHTSGRKPGEPPTALLEHFPPDFLTIIDESHITLGQIDAMFKGDRARKNNLVEFGFRLPSAVDNRPLTYAEFEQRSGATLYVSATPSPRELQRSSAMAEQIIRPTGLLDPLIEVRPTTAQMEDAYAEIQQRVERHERVLMLTLTKKMAEILSDYLLELGVKARYLHSEIGALERVDILHGLREGEFDVLVGINLLREGLDLPEVSLVVIFDADKIGFLRSSVSLIQMIGRAARNSCGSVIMYADRHSEAMEQAIRETARRRSLQELYNKEHGITPQSIRKKVRSLLDRQVQQRKANVENDVRILREGMNIFDRKQRLNLIKALKTEMLEHAKKMQFEEAAQLRDEIARLEQEKF